MAAATSARSCLALPRSLPDRLRNQDQGHTPDAPAYRASAAKGRPGYGELWLSDDDARFNLPRLPTAVSTSFTSSSPIHGGRRSTSSSVYFRRPSWTCWRPSCDPAGCYTSKVTQEYGELVRYLVEGHGAFGPNDSSLARRIGASAPTHRERWCQVHGKLVFVLFHAQLRDAGGAVRLTSTTLFK